MNQEYIQGFVKACEAQGVDPEVLVKAAQLTSTRQRQQAGRTGGIIGGLMGAGPGAGLGYGVGGAATVLSKPNLMLNPKKLMLILAALGVGGATAGALAGGAAGRGLGRLTVSKTPLEQAGERVKTKASDLSEILKQYVDKLKG